MLELMNNTGFMELSGTKGSSSTKETFEEFSCDYFLKAKHAALYLSQISHAKLCQGSCGDIKCINSFTIINHCVTCLKGDNCNTPGCQTTRRLMNHSQSCSSHMVRKMPSSVAFVEPMCLICTLAAKLSLSPQYLSKPNDSSGRVAIYSGSNRTQSSSTGETLSSFTQNSNNFSLPSQSMCTNNGDQGHFDAKCINTILPFAMSSETLIESINQKRDGEFIIPTKMPKRFRRMSESDAEFLPRSFEFNLNESDAKTRSRFESM